MLFRMDEPKLRLGHERERTLCATNESCEVKGSFFCINDIPESITSGILRYFRFGIRDCFSIVCKKRMHLAIYLSLEILLRFLRLEFVRI